MTGRLDETLAIRSEVYDRMMALDESCSRELTIVAGMNLGNTLINLGEFDRAKEIMHKVIPATRRVLGDHEHLFKLRRLYARSLYENAAATESDLREAMTMLEVDIRRAKQIFGEGHPNLLRARDLREDAEAAFARHPEVEEKVIDVLAQFYPSTIEDIAREVAKECSGIKDALE
jgi:hypothetical protein